MSLLNEIYAAQRDAGEAAVIANLRRQGLIPASEPEPMNPQDIINKLEGEAVVLRGLLLECTSIIAEIESESDEEAALLDDLHSKIIKAVTGVTP